MSDHLFRHRHCCFNSGLSCALDDACQTLGIQLMSNRRIQRMQNIRNPTHVRTLGIQTDRVESKTGNHAKILRHNVHVCRLKQRMSVYQNRLRLDFKN